MIKTRLYKASKKKYSNRNDAWISVKKRIGKRDFRGRKDGQTKTSWLFWIT